MSLSFLIKRFKRSFEYFKMGWKDRDWDYGFLLDMEYKKLIHMKDYFEKSKIAESDKDVHRDISLAIKLLDIIKETDSSAEFTPLYQPKDPGYWTEIKYVNTNNANRFFKSGSFLKMINSCDDIGIILRSELRVEKAWHLYCELRKTKLRSWWD